MNIVIVGAGSLGRYLATLLSKEKHNVLVIDKDKKKLEQLSLNTDVATRLGSGSDWQMLDDLLELFPELLIAVTTDDNTNLVCCSLAKQLGYPATIARVHDNRFLNRTRLDFGRVFDVDHFICPELLTANEILKYIVSDGSLAVEYFAHGAVQLRTLKIPANWNKPETELKEMKLPPGVIVGLIYRKNASTLTDSIIFPHGNDKMLPGDEVTFIGETEAIGALHRFFNIKQKEIRSVVIVGGSLTAIHLARLLEKRHLGIRIIERDYDRAAYLADHLPHTTIVNHDALDIEFMRSEKVDQADLLIACTQHDETNLMVSMLGKEIGCEDVLMMLSDNRNVPILQRLGVGHVVSPVMSASNRILSQILTGTVNTLVSMYDNRAEVIEVNVSMDSKVVGIPLSDLGPLLPKDFLIAMIQNRGRIMVANGTRIISPGDTVIVITDPKHAPELERIF